MNLVVLLRINMNDHSLDLVLISESTSEGRRRIVRFYIGRGGERNILYKGVETSPKNLELWDWAVTNGIRVRPWGCASEESEPQREVNMRRSASEDARP